MKQDDAAAAAAAAGNSGISQWRPPHLKGALADDPVAAELVAMMAASWDAARAAATAKPCLAAGETSRGAAVAHAQQAATAADQGQGITAWHDALQQLTGLHELIVKQFRAKPDQLELSWKCLPASLEVLECGNVCITATAPPATRGLRQTATSRQQGYGATEDHQLQSVVEGSVDGSANSMLRLQKLSLVCCRVGNPNILASRQLHQLTVINSTCLARSVEAVPAASLWPNVVTITWQYNSSATQDQDRGLDLLLAAAAVSNHQMAATTTGVGGMVQNPAVGMSQPVQSVHPAVLELQSLCAKSRYLRALTVTEFACKLAAENLHVMLSLVKDSTCLRICIKSRVNDSSWGSVPMWAQQQAPWATIMIETNS